MNNIVNKQIEFKTEVNRCVWCHNATCNSIYKNINPERIIRTIKFDDDRKTKLNGAKCVRCQLCRLVCPCSAIEKS